MNNNLVGTRGRPAKGGGREEIVGGKKNQDSILSGLLWMLLLVFFLNWELIFIVQDYALSLIVFSVTFWNLLGSCSLSSPAMWAWKEVLMFPVFVLLYSVCMFIFCTGNHESGWMNQKGSSWQHFKTLSSCLSQTNTWGETKFGTFFLPGLIQPIFTVFCLFLQDGVGGIWFFSNTFYSPVLYNFRKVILLIWRPNLNLFYLGQLLRHTNKNIVFIKI